MKKVIAAILAGIVLNTEFIIGMKIPVNIDYSDEKQRWNEVCGLILQPESSDAIKNYVLRDAKSRMSKIVTDSNMQLDFLDDINASNSFRDLRSIFFLMIKLRPNVN